MQPRSRRSTQSLASIMENWRGEDVVLRAQGNKITIIQNKQYNMSRRCDNAPTGLFSRIAQANTHTYNAIYNTSNNVSVGNWNTSRNYHAERDRDVYNVPKLSHNKSQTKFVLRANLQASTHRVSLADLGQLYNQNKLIQEKTHKKKRLSQYYQTQNQNSNYNTVPYNNNITYQNAGYHPRTQSEYQTNLKYATLYHEHPQSQNKQNQIWRAPQKTNTKYQQKNICAQSQSENIGKIMQSIKQIKLPDNQYSCPQYAKANQRFEKMKGEILQKIIVSGQVNQMDEIIKQIRQAADNIIAKHYPQQPPLKKHGVFSFKDQILDNHIQKQQKTAPKQILNQIQEQLQQKCQQINLPQFKDDGGSISSIMSIGPNKKDQSKDQDLCKIDNIFINQSNNCVENNQSNNNSSSIRPIVISNLDKKQDSSYQKKLIQQVKIEQSIAQAQMSMRAILQSDAFNKPNNKTQQIVQPKIENILTFINEPLPQQKKQLNIQPKIQLQKDIQKKQNPQNQPGNIINVDNRYTLQKLTKQPVKIIRNLQQAQQFDPEIVKFTQLKVNFLQTRVRTPQIIRIPSPLRFRRKQQVVKCLVDNNIVERQSTSIQF